MQLHYIGSRPERGGAIPLPEGWPIEDHEEPDESVAAAKVASGMYAVAGEPEVPGEVEETDGEP